MQATVPWYDRALHLRRLAAPMAEPLDNQRATRGARCGAPSIRDGRGVGRSDVATHRKLPAMAMIKSRELNGAACHSIYIQQALEAA